MNDNIVRPGFHPRPREARCTGSVPSEAPDAAHMTGGNFRPAGTGADLQQALIQIAQMEALLKGLKHAVLNAMDDGGDVA